MSPAQLQLVLLGVVLTVIAGNLLFWGNRNILGDLASSDDGLISLFGPFYHFDVLLPVSAFAGHTVVAGHDHLRARLHGRGAMVRMAVALVLVAGSGAVAAAEADVVGQPLERNIAYTEKYEVAYEPFTTTELTNALVFLPPTYDEWRNHPFQWLRNDPGLDGPTVFVLSRNPADDFAVLDAYPDRARYRYRYHGHWTPDPNRLAYPLLEPIDVVTGEAVTARTTVAVPDRIADVTVTVSTARSVHRYDLDGEPPAELPLEWTISTDGVKVRHPDLRPRGGTEPRPAPIDRPQEVVVAVTLVEPEGSTLTYREAVLVRPSDRGVAVIWPPASAACPLVTDCGLTGTYLPDRPSTRPSGIVMNSTLIEVTP